MARLDGFTAEEMVTTVAFTGALAAVAASSKVVDGGCCRTISGEGERVASFAIESPSTAVGLPAHFAHSVWSHASWYEYADCALHWPLERCRRLGRVVARSDVCPRCHNVHADRTGAEVAERVELGDDRV
jgi:hypothetical protein